MAAGAGRRQGAQSTVACVASHRWPHLQPAQCAPCCPHPKCPLKPHGPTPGLSAGMTRQPPWAPSPSTPGLAFCLLLPIALTGGRERTGFGGLLFQTEPCSQSTSACSLRCSGLRSLARSERMWPLWDLPSDTGAHAKKQREVAGGLLPPGGL